MLLRTKLFAGLMLLFVVISLLASVGGYAVHKLYKNSEETLSNNFTSINYTVEMLNSLDEVKQAQQTMLHNSDYSAQITADYKEAKANFERNFELQAANSTEQNEAISVTRLYASYKEYIASFEIAQSKNDLSINFYQDKIEPAYINTKNQILTIYKLNKDAVLMRHASAKEFTYTNSLFIITLGFLGVSITFVFILYFPIYITKPLIGLKEKLQAVANYDYSHQLQINSTDELGMLAATFNTMINRLKEYEESSVTKLIYTNQHTQAIMNQLQEGVLVVDENLKIVAINNLLAHLMQVHPKDWTGKYAPDMALKSNLMRKLIAPALRNRSIDNHTSLSSNTNLVPEENKEEYSRILHINDHGQEYIYQVTQQKFYTNIKNNKQFAGYIITVKEVVEKKPQISQMQTNAFLNQLEYNLAELKQNEENEKTLQHINNLIDTTQKFNSTLNGRLNITH